MSLVCQMFISYNFLHFTQKSYTKNKTETEFSFIFRKKIKQIKLMLFIKMKVYVLSRKPVSLMTHLRSFQYDLKLKIYIYVIINMVGFLLCK